MGLSLHRSVVAAALVVAAGSAAAMPACAGTGNSFIAAEGGTACPEGQHNDTTGACVAGPPPECPAGSMKVLGEAACTPIGWNDCSGEFEKDPSGWGCREVLPTAACSGATRAALGSKTCVPVGDCDAPLPSNARLFVSATGATDATHFRTLDQAALASRSGDVIAIEPGTYRGSAQLDRAVTIVGRCAEKVILDGTGVSTPGLIVLAQSTVRGVTIRKFPVAVQAEASFTIEDSVFEDNDDIGIYSDGSAIVGKLARSVIRGTRAAGMDTAFGVDLALGTAMEISDSEIAGSQGAGIIVTPGSRVTMTSSVVHDNIADRRSVGGYGINGQGGDATIERSAFIDNADTGIRAYKGGRFTVESTVVRGTKPGDRGRGYGMVASEGGTLTASKVVVTETVGVGVVTSGGTAKLTDVVVRGQVAAPDGDFGDGVYAFNAGTLSLTRVAVLDNTRAGISVFDAKTEATLDHVFLSGTKPLPTKDMGLGIIVGLGAHAKIDAAVIVSNRHTGIYVDRSTLDVTRTAIRDTALQGSRVPLGHGLLAIESSHVVVDRCEVRRSAGIGMAFANTSATVTDTVVAENAVGIHVQEGSTLEEVETAPASPSGGKVDVTKSTRFEGNATKVGSGVIPLPDPLKGL